MSKRDNRQNRKSQFKSSSLPSMIEAFEPRRLLSAAPTPTLSHGMLTVSGTHKSDHIAVELHSSKIAVTVDGVTNYYASSKVKGITVNAGAGNDDATILDTGGTFTTPVTVNGEAGDDRITGASENDDFNGDAGNDSLIGASGDDTLFGDDGADSIVGGNGNDHCSGGMGDDSISGGKGNDIFDTGDSSSEDKDRSHNDSRHDGADDGSDNGGNSGGDNGGGNHDS